ncbi:MAG: phosphoglycerate mutase family protein [Paracoccaceae bacterium]|nr:phosphoglycerate mutase family protein [Paracoccaceae bacterium]
MRSGETFAVYLTHPEVVIDPAIPVAEWGLTPAGAARAMALAERLPGGDIHVASSAERKALETAWPLAAHLGIDVEVRPAMHENDRSATGFLPGPEFEEAANAFFASPEESVRGWERAADAQARILREVSEVLAAQASRSLIFAGHGGVGTLLLCALAGRQISREWDQKGSGQWFAFDPASRKALTDWAPLETLFA